VILDVILYFAPFAALPNWDMWLCMSPANLLLCFQLPHHANVPVAFLTYSQHARACQHEIFFGRNERERPHLLPFLASDSLASFGSKVALNTVWHPAQVNAHSLF
jgi:hypothetical protein